jgi:hypothetical protein
MALNLGTEGETVLYQLAQSLAAGGDHSTAIALRKLLQAGYTTLKQVDALPDSILLSIPGLGVKRLNSVRALTRTDWQPPSAQAIQVATWFLTAARFALRFWTPETLTSVIRGSSLNLPSGSPVEERLAMDVFSHAARKAMGHCPAQELIQILHVVRNGHGKYTDHDPGLLHERGQQSSMDADGQCGRMAPSAPQVIRAEEATHMESDHYAYPRHKRREIVQEYRLAHQGGQVVNKDSWAQANYSISGRTLRRYEREYLETAEDIQL